MIRYQIKDWFFTSKRVVAAVDRERRKILSAAGAFIRQRARSLIRRRKKPSAPGKPPSSHTGRLRGGIMFGFDPQTASVVVGPIGFGNSQAPAALELGGTSRDARGQAHQYKARPFMRPAFDEEVRRMPQRWRNVIKGE